MGNAPSYCYFTKRSERELVIIEMEVIGKDDSSILSTTNIDFIKSVFKQRLVLDKDLANNAWDDLVIKGREVSFSSDVNNLNIDISHPRNKESES